MAGDHNIRRYVDKPMHLFDFNETLSGKRLPDERRAALEYQMERLYKSRNSADPSNPRPKREDGEILMRNAQRIPDRKMHVASETLTKGHNSGREIDAKQRGPSVVARLMGLDTLPIESKPTKPSPGDALPLKQSRKKSGVDQQVHARIEKPERQHTPVQKQSREEKPKFTHPRFSDDRKRNGVVKNLPEMHELEEMKRQLSLKQMLVREKLNEAKRLLTGEKLVDKKWIAASEKLNQSKEFLDAIDFFHTNRDAFLKYVDDQDSVLGKHIEASSERAPRHPAVERPVPEGLRNPIVRKVIEGRREDALRNSIRPSDYGCEDNARHPVSDNQVATRIVVLKPSPNRTSSPTPSSFSSGPYEFPKPQPAVARRVADTPKEEASTNPREIAKEIARQVRESVVRDLARNAAGSIAELGSEKRLNVTLDNLDGPRLTRSDYINRGGSSEGVTTPTAKAGKSKPKVPLEHLHFEETGRRLSGSSVQSSRKPSRPRQASGSSPPLTRPVSKGIVVLIPDQSVGSRSGKVSEIQNASVNRSPRKDRNRKSQQFYLDSAAHKLGDTLRKPRSFDEKRSDTDTDLTDRNVTQSVKEDGRIGDSSSDSGVVSGSAVLGYAGSFLLKPSGFESQAENEDASCECSETKETLESEYTADVCISDIRSPPENLSFSSDLVSSCDSVPSVPSEPSTATVNQCEQEQSELLVFEPPETSSDCLMTDIETVVEVVQEETFKDTRTATSTDVLPDVDGTSISSDNSGQPSPISVLDSSFEESPPRVDFDTISSELEELRLQLRLLKWDGHEEPSAEELESSTDDLLVVDKVVVEEIVQPEGDKTASIIVEDMPAADTSHELWLELDKVDTINLLCPEGRKEEQLYVKNILLAAKLIRSGDTSMFLVEYYSPRHALDPVLFDKLEAYYRARAGDADDVRAKSYARFKRKHLFDAVNEILTQNYASLRPWLSSARAISCGGFLLAEVWSKLCDYFEYPQGEDLQHTVENLIEKYLTKGERWMDLRAHVEAIGVEVERLILSELLDESVCCLDL